MNLNFDDKNSNYHPTGLLKKVYPIHPLQANELKIGNSVYLDPNSKCPVRAVDPQNIGFIIEISRRSDEENTPEFDVEVQDHQKYSRSGRFIDIFEDPYWVSIQIRPHISKLFF